MFAAALQLLQLCSRFYDIVELALRLFDYTIENRAYYPAVRILHQLQSLRESKSFQRLYVSCVALPIKDQVAARLKNGDFLGANDALRVLDHTPSDISCAETSQTILSTIADSVVCGLGRAIDAKCIAHINTALDMLRQLRPSTGFSISQESEVARSWCNLVIQPRELLDY
jgi:hypothetical protein